MGEAGTSDERVVSVIVPAYNDPLLPSCLEALSCLETPEGWRIELVVVDNLSDQPLAALADAWPEVTFLVETRRGSYAARNAGLALACGEVLAFTDSDCRPAEDWLVVALRRLEEEPGVSAVAGRVDNVFDSGRPSSPVGWWEAVEAFPQHEYVANGYGVTANLVVRRVAGESVGWFDGEAQSGGDADFGRRLTQSGGVLRYEADAVVRHPARTTWRELTAKGRRTAKGHARMEELRGGGVLQVLRSIYALIKKLTSVVERSLVRPELDGPSARLQYLCVGLAFRTFWFVEMCRWRVRYHRQAARGALI